MTNVPSLPLIGGAVTYWTVGERTDRQKLLNGLVPLQLARFTPPERTPLAALGDALRQELGGPTVLVRPLAKRQENGFAVVDETRGASRNDYCLRLTARIDQHADLQLARADGSSHYDGAVLAAFRLALGHVTPAAVSQCLVEVLEHLGGTRLRPNGAIYWLPDRSLEIWQAVADAVERAAVDCVSRVYVLRTVMDVDTVRAVRDAIVAEVSAEARLIEEEVAAGELGPKALARRQTQARKLHGRVAEYEDLLGEALDVLHQALDAAQQAAAVAQATSEHVEDGTFEAVFGQPRPAAAPLAGAARAVACVWCPVPSLWRCLYAP